MPATRARQAWPPDQARTDQCNAVGDGVIDGVASGSTSSLFSDQSTDSFTFDFDAAAFGGALPTHAGIVWTDVGRNGGGTPFASNLIDNTFFEAFDADGNSLGVIGPFSLGDTSISRTTPEDRFFGIVYAQGISAIRLSMPGLTNWEADHLQYGFADFENDADADGVADDADNCINATNPNQLDADNDGHGNCCDADFVNVVDLGLMRAAFFTTNEVVDLNSDGVVNVIDLGLLRSVFFTAPGPSPVGSLCNP
ncbi:MAG: hypothetical protein AB8G16_07555 [Gammaproteobacteria bacterium]